jgi:hypothetical protein
MSRLFGVLVFAISIFSVDPAFAWQRTTTTRRVPELSSSGAAAGLALIAGAAAIAFGRKRSRK